MAVVASATPLPCELPDASPLPSLNVTSIDLSTAAASASFELE